MNTEAEQVAAKSLLDVARTKGAAITRTDRGYLLVFTSQMLVRLLHSALISESGEGPGLCGLVVGTDSEVDGSADSKGIAVVPARGLN